MSRLANMPAALFRVSMLLPPNKRLKLAGVDRSSGSGVLCPDGHELTFDINAPCWRVARSLSAIR